MSDQTPESRSVQRRKAVQRGEPMPTFTPQTSEERLREALDDNLVPWWKVPGTFDEGVMRRCLLCGRTSNIAPEPSTASVTHESDCPVVALNRALTASTARSPDRDYVVDRLFDHIDAGQMTTNDGRELVKSWLASTVRSEPLPEVTDDDYGTRDWTVVTEMSTEYDFSGGERGKYAGGPLRAALERLIAWHNQKPLEGPRLPSEVERWWAEWAMEEMDAFQQAEDALRGTQ